MLEILYWKSDTDNLPVAAVVFVPDEDYCLGCFVWTIPACPVPLFVWTDGDFAATKFEEDAWLVQAIPAYPIPLFVWTDDDFATSAAPPPTIVEEDVWPDILGYIRYDTKSVGFLSYLPLEDGSFTPRVLLDLITQAGVINTPNVRYTQISSD